MRKITLLSVAAFLNGTTFTSGNMHVSKHVGIAGPVTSMYLHGNLIAEKCGFGGDYNVTLRDANWQTTTTKERLNGILDTLRGIAPGVGIYQKDHAWYINGEDWEGSIRVIVRDYVVKAIESTRDNGDTIDVPLQRVSA